MLEHIEKLRGKSEGEKRRFVLLFSAGVTLVIAFFWTIALVIKIGGGSLSFEVNTPKEGFFGDIGDKVNSSWEEFFPDSNPAAEPEMEVVLSAPTEEVAEDPYPALRVMLGEPESVDTEAAYPADVY